MNKKIPVGIENFKELIEEDYYYVDKTDIIEELITNGAKVSLFPRPRRFGKTLTISMLDEYFNVAKKEENKDLFKELKVNHSEAATVKEAQGKFPVISIGLKGIKDLTWESEYNKLKRLIMNIYVDNKVVIESLDDSQKEYYNDILNGTAPSNLYQLSINMLCRFLEKHYGEKVIVLIDEYDAPIESSFLNGFYDECINFMRNLFGEALKTNNSLKFGVLTGILKVSKESIFSGLNNLKIYSVLDESYSEYFGFTPKEVDAMLDFYNIDNELKNKVTSWYNGYNFGGTSIFNPWSIINFVSDKELKPYWSNTGGTSLLEDMLAKANISLKETLKILLDGELYKSVVSTDIVYADIDNKDDSILSFLLMTGYLTYNEKIINDKGVFVEYKVPNKEVEKELANIIERWFVTTKTYGQLNEFNTSLLNNKVLDMNLYLNQILQGSISYYDTKENFYHGLMLGMLVGLGDSYKINSNRESGEGRYDLMIYNKDLSWGAILEFKVLRYDDQISDDRIEVKSQLVEMANTAKKQIETRDYITELKSLGIDNIYTYGVAFNKKQSALV